MTVKKEHTTILGVGAAACAACCAGPILGILTAIGLGTAAGFLLTGDLALLVGAAAIAVVVLRRHQRTITWPPLVVDPSPIQRSCIRPTCAAITAHTVVSSFADERSIVHE